MIDIEKARRLFKEYVSKYDSENPMIARKIAHSYRVEELSKTIAKSLNLTQDQIDLAELIGLLHDIGRFEQAKVYNTYSDRDSIDHADYGVKVLKENDFISQFCENKDEQLIILKAIKNHNKYKIESDLNEELLQAKIIRDADKIDIYNLYSKEREIKDSSIEPTKEVVEAFYRKEEINRSICKNDTDELILELGMVFDINFKKSFEILKEKDYISTIADKCKLKEDYKNFVNNYISERT